MGKHLYYCCTNQICNRRKKTHIRGDNFKNRGYSNLEVACMGLFQSGRSLYRAIQIWKKPVRGYSNLEVVCMGLFQSGRSL